MLSESLLEARGHQAPLQTCSSLAKVNVFWITSPGNEVGKYTAIEIPSWERKEISQKKSSVLQVRLKSFSVWNFKICEL